MKIDGIDGALPTLGTVVDVQDVLPCVCGLESQSQLCQEDLDRKATTTELEETMSDKVSNTIKTVRQEAHNRSAEIDTNLEVQWRKMKPSPSQELGSAREAVRRAAQSA